MALFDFFKRKPTDPAGSGPPSAGDPGPTEGAASGADADGSDAAGEPPRPELLEAVDGLGRRVQMTREEYRTKVIPELVKAHGSDPQQLSAVIMQGVQQGFATDLVGAANRLVVIDEDPERALTILAVTQRDAGDLEASEFTLKELLQKRPDSAAPRVGLAMLAHHRGDLAGCEKLMWQAVEADPNHADAVHGWLQIRHQQVGDEGYRAEVDKLVALPGTWRPQLWRARLDLQQDRTDEALATYREQFAREEVLPDMMLMAATDLARAGQHEAVAELIVPRFVAGHHHPHVGMALLDHYVHTGQHVAGAELLHQMYLHYADVVGDQLQPYTAEFDRMRLADLPELETPDEVRVGLYRLVWPAFCAGLADPQWLLPKKPEGHKQILFTALSVEGEPEAHQGPEQDLGRATRSVPLFLAEHVWLASPHRGTVALTMSDSGGWLVMPRRWPEEQQIVEQLNEAEKADTILVTGALRFDGDERRIDLWAYDVAKGERVGHAVAEGKPDGHGEMLLQLLAEFWPLIGGQKEHKPPVGDVAFWGRHADGLGQHASLLVARAGAMPKERLYGERYILQWLQTTALMEPRWQPGFWLYSSALCLLHEMGSPLAREHARTIGELFRQSPPNSPFARIAVRPLLAVGLDSFWQQRRAEIVEAADGDIAYSEWLERAEALR